MPGGAGFIGSHLVSRLVERKERVDVLHRPGGDVSRLRPLGGKVGLWPCDLLDARALAATIDAIRPDAVFHLAADTNLRHLDPELSGVLPSVEGNLRTSLNVLLAANAARPPVPLLIRLGSIEEYGRGPVPSVESQREEPASPYSASHVATTHYLGMLAPRLACRTVTVRPALIYGPGQSRSFFVPSLIEHCLSGRDFTVRTPDHVRDLLHVDDLVDALLLLLDAALPAGDVLNVGSGRGVAMRDVAASIVRLSGSSIRLVEGTPPPDAGIPRLLMSREKASTLLGWSPRIDLEEGLARTIEAHRRVS